MPYSEWLISHRYIFLTVSGARKFEIKMSGEFGVSKSPLFGS